MRCSWERETWRQESATAENELRPEEHSDPACVRENSSNYNVTEEKARTQCDTCNMIVQMRLSQLSCPGSSVGKRTCLEHRVSWV